MINELIILNVAKKGKKTKNNVTSKNKIENRFNSRDYSFSEDFKTIFLLLISLLYGNMFFELCDGIHNIILDYKVVSLSILLLQLSSYFRIVVSHLLSVIKYSNNWQMRFYDFFLVFITAFFEYSLIKIEIFSSLLGTEVLLPSLMIAFSMFSIIGFYTSYKRAVEGKEVCENIRQDGKRLQFINITLLFFVILLNLLSLTCNNLFVVSNFISSCIILLSLVVAIMLSKKYFKMPDIK
ncbi:MAG: hypothetical protein Q4A41_00575 [Bacillota bacterium]|nr:hypothetical protein [Bacillota bacterium]